MEGSEARDFVRISFQKHRIFVCGNMISRGPPGVGGRWVTYMRSLSRVSNISRMPEGRFFRSIVFGFFIQNGEASFMWR